MAVLGGKRTLSGLSFPLTMRPQTARCSEEERQAPESNIVADDFGYSNECHKASADCVSFCVHHQCLQGERNNNRPFGCARDARPNLASSPFAQLLQIAGGLPTRAPVRENASPDAEDCHRYRDENHDVVSRLEAQEVRDSAEVWRNYD